MNIRYFVYVGVLSLCPLMNAVDKKIVLAIRSSDVEALRKTFIAGDTIPLSDKRVYMRLAHETTKEAHISLESFGFNDVKHGIMGSLKALAAGLSAITCWKHLTEQKDYRKKGAPDAKDTSLFDLAKNEVAPIVLSDPNGACSILASAASKNLPACGYMALSLYLAGKSIQDVFAIMYKNGRYENLLRAFAVEALVNNLPV